VTGPVAGTRGSLLRALGLAFGLAVILGNTIGAGILRTAGSVAADLPNGAVFLAVWIAGGLYAFLGSAQVAELGTAIPRAGGQYAFSSRALGPYAGFIVGMSDWLSTCGSTAAVSIVIGEYAGALVPALASARVAVALGVTVGFALLQWRGVKWGGRAQEITSLAKALAFIGLIAACFALGGRGEPISAPAPMPLPSGWSLAAALVLVLQSVIYTYDGWTGVIYFSEEVRDPARDIPRSMFGGVAAVMTIYVLLNAAVLYVLPIEAIARSDFAVGVAAVRIFGTRGEEIIRALVIVSMLSGINAYHLMATRTCFAMSRDGLFHPAATRVNRGGTPTIALLISTLVAMGFLLSGTFDQVMAVLAFFFVTNYALSFASLFVLRRREPDLPRPYRAWGYPWTSGVALGCAVAFLVGAIIADLRNSLTALGLLAISYPLFRLIHHASQWYNNKNGIGTNFDL
jgi:APA family basic amino acid/polyamine antiporter